MDDVDDSTVPRTGEEDLPKHKEPPERKTTKMSETSEKKDTDEKKTSDSPTVSKTPSEKKNKPDSSKSDVKPKSPTKTGTTSAASGKDKKATLKSSKSTEKTEKSSSASKSKSPAVLKSTKLEDTKKSENVSSRVDSDKQTETLTKPSPQTETVTKTSDSSLEVKSDQSAASVLEEKTDSVITTTPKTQQISREQGKNIDKVEEDPEKAKSGGWNWGKWGASIVDAASTSVSTFSSQVGEGFHTIIETVETSLAGPLPEDMDEQERRMYEEQGMGDALLPEGDPEEAAEMEDGAKGGSWFGGWGMSDLTTVVQSTTAGVTNLTKKVQNKGKSLMTGGLDVLETIGKKTYDVITEHDPGLKRTRQVLFDRGVKPNLSYVLREAKEQADEAAALRKEAEEARKVHFGAMFDEYQGLAHLEALEILSNQSEKQVQSLLSAMPVEILDKIKQELIAIKQVFELEEEDEEEERDHDFVKLITDNLLDLHLGTTPDKINKAHEKIRKWIVDFYEKEVSPKEIHEAAIQSLAEMTAKSVEQFHKAGELIMLQKDTEKTFLERAKSLASLTKVLCTEAGILSNKFVKCLNKVAENAENEDGRKINMMITNVYLEATNSSTYTQDAFQLLLPVLQQGAIENSKVLAQ